MAQHDTDLALVTRAAALAGAAHVKQKRKVGDEPYINHPLRVARAAAEAGLGAPAIAAALLHDVVEDTDTTLDDLARAFPARVVELVRLMTQWWPDDAPREVKLAEMPAYYRAIAADADATAIKLLDRADNLDSMSEMLPLARGWATRYLRKSIDEVGPLAEAAAGTPAAAAFLAAVARLDAALRRGGNAPDMAAWSPPKHGRRRP